MDELHEGTKLKSIFWENGELTLGIENTPGTVVESLTVVMQSGQLAWVPWVQVVWSNGERFLFNCAVLEGLQILTEEVSEEA